MGVDFDQQNRIPTSTLQELRGILMSSLSRENLGMLDSPPEPRRRKVRFEDNAGAAPVEANQRQSRSSSITKAGAALPALEDLEQDLHSGDPGARDQSGGGGGASQDREERARLVRERQNSERARKLEELRAQALAAQRFREQKEEERRHRIDEMRSRDNDRRLQVEERKRAIWEAERERREAIVRRNEEREARLEVRRRGGAGAVGIFAFGSSTPRMLEPADTGGTFWGHRRATSTSNVMFAALPLSRRSSERELDPNKKRATSASGLDRQGADEESSGDGAPWSRVARRRTDLVPTITAPRTPRSPGRAYSMSRLDQLAQPRRTPPAAPGPAPAPARPPRARPPAHRSVGNLLAAMDAPAPPPRRKQGSGLRSGEVTPGSPSRPGSSLSSASTVGAVSAMTSSVMGTLVNRRPRAAPRRPRPASIAGTGVTTPPHVKTNTVGADGKLIGVRAEKPPLPRVHSAGTTKKGMQQPPTPTQDKPEVPKRAHKGGSVKASPRLTPRSTPLQSPATDLPPSILHDVQETVSSEESATTVVTSDSQVTSSSTTESEVSSATITETVKQITKEDGEETTLVTTVTTVTSSNNGEVVQNVTEAVTVTEDKIEDVKAEISPAQKTVEVVKKVKEEVVEVITKPQDVVQQIQDPLENADMTASMAARRGVITTEEGAKAALAERRRLAREEAERQAERERLRLEKEEEEEQERQRQEEERQRRLEEETIRLSELQRQSEEERLQQAILEAQRRTEEENQRREAESRARAEREVAEQKAREELEKARREATERARKEEEEREARRKRVDAIMQRTRQAKQKKDGDKSPTEENKSLEEADQIENKMGTGSSEQELTADAQQVDIESSYEQSVREREEALLNHSAPHNRAQVTNNGMNTFQNGTPAPTNGAAIPEDRSPAESTNHYAVQNGHSKSQMNELNNFINTSENQYNNVALDNTVIQNNVANLLDISEADLLNSANKNNPFLVDVNTNGSSLIQPLNSQQIEGNNITQMIHISGDSITKNFVNEDSINSNQTSNSPFITSFQDNQENRDVSLL